MPAARDIYSEEGAELVQSVHRVAELPVVAAVVGGVLGVYEKAKQSPVPLLGRTLVAAEVTAKYAAAQAYSVALKFERPIGYIDSVACKGLDTLEDKLPIVKRAPEQIMADAKAYVTDKALAPVNMLTQVKTMGVAKVDAAADYGRGKVTAVADYGMEKVIQAAKSPIGQWALSNFETVVTTLDGYVDAYVPAEEPDDEGVKGIQGKEENWDPALAPIAHATKLTDKLRRRLYKRTIAKAVAKARVAQHKCTDAFDGVRSNGFVDYVRLQLTTGSQALTDATNAIWNETANITPGRAAQALTTGMNVIEARTALAARKLLQYLQWNYAEGQKTAEQGNEYMST